MPVCSTDQRRNLPRCRARPELRGIDELTTRTVASKSLVGTKETARLRGRTPWRAIGEVTRGGEVLDSLRKNLTHGVGGV